MSPSIVPDLRLEGPSRAEHRLLIERLTREAEQDPAGYRRRVVWLVAQGYGYLIGSLLTVVALLALLVVLAFSARGYGYVLLKGAAPLLLLGLAIARSIWVRIPEPAGQVISIYGFPALQDLIEDLRARTGAPRLERVLLTNELNAGIIQIPRLGPFGWSRSYLLLGLPLLEGLSVEEVKSVLAHEFGHLSRSHGRFGAWIYRLRTSWFALSAQLQAQQTSLAFFRSFFLAFLPRFDATTFVLARRHEYEADEMAAALGGAPTAATALARNMVLDRMVQERFWGSIDTLNSETGRAPEDIEVRKSMMIRAGVDPATAQTWLEDALRRPTDLDDTHPSLADRLEGFGTRISGADVAGPIGESAADRLLGADAITLFHAQWSIAWHDSASDRWRSEYERREGFRRTYLDLKERVQQGHLSQDERSLYGSLVWKFEGLEPAIQIARQEIEERPDSHLARLRLGMMLLNLHREEGLGEIGFVAEREPALAVEECQRAYDWLFAQGRSSEADEWHDLWSRCAAWREHGRAERSTVNLEDEFLPALLPADLATTIQSAAASVRDLRSDWLVRKQVLVLPSEACHMLFLRPGQAFVMDANRRYQKIVTQLEKGLPQAGLKIVFLTPKMKPLVKKLDAIPGARLR